MLPTLLEVGDMPRAAGFLRFALRRLAVGILAAAAVGLAWGLSSETAPPVRAAIAAGALALPAAVLAQAGLEVLTAAGRVRAATIVVRVAVPGSVLLLVAGVTAAGATLTGAAVIAAWGCAWVAALIPMLLLLRRDLAPVLRAKPVYETSTWRAAARPLWLYRLAVGLQAQAGILALGGFGASPVAVGAYAAATAIISPALVLATSTNRAYSRDIAVLLARRDVDGLSELARRRRRWLHPALAVFATASFAFAGPLLALFRPEFVAAGTWPARILAIAAAISIALSLSPTVLKYRDRSALVLRAVAIAVAIQIVLLACLVPVLGATGAALSYLGSVTLLYAWCAVASKSDLKRIGEEARASAGASIP
jgi:O-antigen/teichoic acid export membrane protein